MEAVLDYLENKGRPYVLREHPPTFTSWEEARKVGVDPDRVAKSLLVDTVRGHALAVIPASRRLDMKRLRAAVADPHARLSTESELVHDAPQFELGALPPIGSLIGAPTFVDPEVLAHETIVFAAGRVTGSIEMLTEDLFAAEHVTPARLCRDRDPDRELELA